MTLAATGGRGQPKTIQNGDRTEQQSQPIYINQSEQCSKALIVGDDTTPYIGDDIQ